jgi:hypothetical protein
MNIINNAINRWLPVTERSQTKEFVLIKAPEIRYKPDLSGTPMHVEAYETYATLKVLGRSVTLFGKYCSSAEAADLDFDRRHTPISRAILAWKMRFSASRYHGPIALAVMKNGRPIPPEYKSKNGLKKATRMFVRLRKRHAY